MCGIFGLVDFNEGASPDRGLVEHATDQMWRRGPDGRGFWFGKRAGFGHRRLAIIDPEGSPQPMTSADGRFVLTYNGELYNYEEIKRDLIREGIGFKTSGDTEVVLRALELWGVGALPKFNGMFAIALWDSLLERLLLARDRHGIKPLLFSHQGRQIAFASEFSAILTLPSISRTPDPLGLTAFLAHYQPTFAGKTIYRDIRTLMPGAYAWFSPDGLEERQFWSLPLIPSESKRERWPDSRIKEAAEETRCLMSNAVKSHCVADVEVGAFLSGGLDSAIILTLMAGQARERVRAYSIGFAETGFNEFEYSIPLVKDLNLRHTLVTLEREEYESRMGELIRLRGAPLSTPNEVPIYCLSLIAAKELKVVLTGEGSDELFGGYAALTRSPYDFASAKLLRERPESLTSTERQMRRDALRKLYGKFGFSSLADHWRTSYAWLDHSDLKTILTPEFLTKAVMEEMDGYWETRLGGLEGLSDYDKYLYLLEADHLKGLLGRLDADTMAASLEGRVPFTDNDLVEFVWGLPFEYKLRWKEAIERPEGLNSLEIAEQYDTAKFILKEAFRDRLPAAIINRKKQAFPVPLDQWLSGIGAAGVIGELESSDRGVFQTDRIGAWANERLSANNGGMKVWMAWGAAKWMKEAH